MAALSKEQIRIQERLLLWLLDSIPVQQFARPSWSGKTNPMLKYRDPLPSEEP